MRSLCSRPIRRRAGADPAFTLIELMIVVAIIGILASIAIPKFSNLLRKSQDGQTKGNLGSLRSAISVYYSDMEGQFPYDPASLSNNGTYLTSIPMAKTANYHADSSGFDYATFGNGNDGGGWQYNHFFTTPNFGTVWVNCDHTDYLGTIWSAY